jgi:hypothetical protein
MVSGESELDREKGDQEKMPDMKDSPTNRV